MGLNFSASSQVGPLGPTLHTGWLPTTITLRVPEATSGAVQFRPHMLSPAQTVARIPMRSVIRLLSPASSAAPCAEAQFRAMLSLHVPPTAQQWAQRLSRGFVQSRRSCRSCWEGCEPRCELRAASRCARALVCGSVSREPANRRWAARQSAYDELIACSTQSHCAALGLGWPKPATLLPSIPSGVYTPVPSAPLGTEASLRAEDLRAEASPPTAPMGAPVNAGGGGGCATVAAVV